MYRVDISNGTQSGATETELVIQYTIVVRHFVRMFSKGR